jgi:hypothetical protein
LRLLPLFDAQRARRCFLAGLGLVYAIAFASLSVQIVGLAGERGILPVGELLDAASRWASSTGRLGEAKHQFPTLCWLDTSDLSLSVQGWTGVALGGLVFLGVAPLLLLPLAWLLYLSLTVAGQDFLQFQWDALLLETGFFAIWIAPAGFLPWGPPRWLKLRRRAAHDPVPPPPPAIAVWALRLLLFRFMFASGYVKLSFGDPVWRDLTALTFHYWTQPLPTPFAWYAHHLPLWFQKLSCAAMFAAELLAPVLLFFGRLGRNLFGLATIGLMVVIAATGNYGFFEPLTAVIALLLLDRPARPAPGDAAGGTADAPLRRPPMQSVLGRSPLASALPAAGGTPRRIKESAIASLVRAISALVAGAASLLGLIQFGHQLVAPRLEFATESFATRALGHALDGIERLCTTRDERTDEPRPRLLKVHAWLDPYRMLNTYGLFRVMTKEREEIVLEGSDDLKTWKPYGFRYKPGDLRDPPCLCQPHMPRLDWQMWFAPFGPPPPWFHRFVQRLLMGEPSVLALLAENPFPDAPPQYLRAVLYDYRFATPQRRAATDEWWFRSEKRQYLRPTGAR